MLKNEFEKMYGQTVADSVYKVIEELYMSEKFADMNKNEFVKYVKKHKLVQTAYEMCLAISEKKLIAIQLEMENLYFYKNQVFENTKMIDTLSPQFTPHTMISCSIKDIHIHNQNLLALAECNTANKVLEILKNEK